MITKTLRLISRRRIAVNSLIKTNLRLKSDSDCSEDIGDICPKFEKDELDIDRLKLETLVKALQPIKTKMPENYDVFEKEIKKLYEDKIKRKILDTENLTLKKINKLNKEKIGMMVEKIKDSE